MAYAKFSLLGRDAFQLSLAAREACRMLSLAEREQPGAYELAYEAAGVGGWDDLVAFSHDNGEAAAQHWQAKDQNSDFEVAAGSDALEGYFAEANALRLSKDPYAGFPACDGKRITFYLAFPGLNHGFRPSGQKEPTKFVHLRDLCNSCRRGAHVQIGATKGATLNQKGTADQHKWLEWVATWLGGDWTAAASLLAQVQVRTLGDAPGLDDEARAFLANSFTTPADCLLAIKEAIQHTPPQARLQVSYLWNLLANRPRLETAPCVVRQHAGAYFSLGGGSSASLISRGWRPHDPPQIRLGFSAPNGSDDDRSLRLQLLRFTVHSERVAAVDQATWTGPVREGLRGALGIRGSGACVVPQHFTATAAPPPLVPDGVHTLVASDLAGQLRESMDEDTWVQVDRRVCAIIARAEAGLAGKLLPVWHAARARIHARWAMLCRRAVRAEGEGIIEDLRVGRRMVEPIARGIVVSVALVALDYTDWPDEPDDLAGVRGSVRLRLLSLEHVACPERGADLPDGIPIAQFPKAFSEGRPYVLGADTSAKALAGLIGQPRLTNQAAYGVLTASDVPVLFCFDDEFQWALQRSEADLDAYFSGCIAAAGDAVRDHVRAALIRQKEAEGAA